MVTKKGNTSVPQQRPDVDAVEPGVGLVAVDVLVRIGRVDWERRDRGVIAGLDPRQVAERDIPEVR